ncbi:MAG: Hpt domain-containing protein [Burkholderiales bacterium]|nr:Hpt domain-containing protein [Burkholderiales bacterium]MDE2394336.1 Hpt domain-containing protein [Burkholderiales bacterium]
MTVSSHPGAASGTAGLQSPLDAARAARHPACPACRSDTPRKTMNVQSNRNPAVSDSVIDEPVLARLRALDPDGSLKVIERVLRTYETSLTAALEQAAQARARDDARALGAVAHKLKSSSASVGALALSACCAEIESAGREGRLDVAAAALRFIDEAERALAAVRAMLRA